MTNAAQPAAGNPMAQRRSVTINYSAVRHARWAWLQYGSGCHGPDMEANSDRSSTSKRRSTSCCGRGMETTEKCAGYACSKPWAFLYIEHGLAKHEHRLKGQKMADFERM